MQFAALLDHMLQSAPHCSPALMLQGHYCHLCWLVTKKMHAFIKNPAAKSVKRCA